MDGCVNGVKKSLESRQTHFLMTGIVSLGDMPRPNCPWSKFKFRSQDSRADGEEIFEVYMCQRSNRYDTNHTTLNVEKFVWHSNYHLSIKEKPTRYEDYIPISSIPKNLNFRCCKALFRHNPIYLPPASRLSFPQPSTRLSFHHQIHKLHNISTPLKKEKNPKKLKFPRSYVSGTIISINQHEKESNSLGSITLR